MKNFIIASVLIISLALGGYYLYFHEKDYTIRISESQVYDRLNEQLPFSKTYLLFFQVLLDNLRVSIDGAEKINVGLDITFSLSLVSTDPLRGSVDISSGIRYDAPKAAFYLSEPQVQKLILEGIPDEFMAKANDVVNTALLEYTKKNPIYVISDKDKKNQATKMLLKKVEIGNEEIVLTLGLE